MTKKELAKKQKELEDAAAAMRAIEDVVATLENAAQAIARLNALKEQLEQAKRD